MLGSIIIFKTATVSWLTVVLFLMIEKVHLTVTRSMKEVMKTFGLGFKAIE